MQVLGGERAHQRRRTQMSEGAENKPNHSRCATAKSQMRTEAARFVGDQVGRKARTIPSGIHSADAAGYPQPTETQLPHELVLYQSLFGSEFVDEVSDLGN